MNKRLTSLLALFLVVCLFSAAVLPAYAAEGEKTGGTELTIYTVDDFLAFAESCRLDSYSLGLTVFLEADIDLSGESFSGIPIFSGTFSGNGHVISGLSVRPDGSDQGLFRYLTSTAVVQELTVSGEVAPGGSRATVGGIAGCSSGKLINCVFSGHVSGGDRVGGLVGTNSVTGLIEGCRVEGIVQGSHFVGGLVGENYGVIRNCTNTAEVNTTVQQNNVELSDITLDTLANSESIATVTDIGGIAGTNGGVIRDCENRGDVGYRQIGYNIGGIAGSHTGYLTGCKNYGEIFGRKEVGGIVGQMEPVTRLEYSEDSLQILQGQLNTMTNLAGQAQANAQSGVSQVTSQVTALRSQSETAREAVDQLLPDLRDPEMPDLDSIRAARSALSSSVSAMPGTLNSIVTASQNTATNLTRDVQAIIDQMNAMGKTINNASEMLGGSYEDVSDQDTEEDFIGKVTACINYGAVLADINTGGITGSMAFENELDHDDDLQISGNSSLNFAGEVRVVVTGCDNRGTVTVNKQNGGGIVGWQSMGLVKHCLNSGALKGQKADYVGGVVGRGSGYIRSSGAKCELSGDTYVGGIAGAGAIVTDCRSMVRLGGTEKTGAVLGGLEQSYAEVEHPVSGNLYLSVDEDLGGVDGISYTGQAEPRTLEEFLALDGLQELFQTVTVRFVFEDGGEQSVNLSPGGRLTAADIPAVPEKNGYTGEWNGLEEADLSDIMFDMVFEAVYTRHSAAVQGSVTHGNELKILLVQGSFTEGAAVTLQEADEVPVLAEGETLLEAWKVEVSNWEAITGGRYLLSKDYNAGELRLLVQDAEGGWREVDFTTEGSYVVFELNGSDRGFALAQVEPSIWSWQLLTAIGVVLLLMIVSCLRSFRARRRKKNGQQEKMELKV